MEKEDCFLLGYFVKTHGLKGALRAKLEPSDSSPYDGIESAYIKIDGMLVPFFMAQFEVLDKGFAHVKLEDVNSIDEAQRYVKKSLYLPSDQMVAEPEGTLEGFDIGGFQVIDSVHGPIGEALEILELPQQMILKVKHNTSEILIPVHQETIVSVDTDTRSIHVQTPEGLIDLYL